MVRGRGFEPPRPYEHCDLNAACLPVPAPAHVRFDLYITPYN